MQAIEIVTPPPQSSLLDTDADKWTHCEECGERIAYNNVFITADGDPICENYRDSGYSLCANCGEYVKNDGIETPAMRTISSLVTAAVALSAIPMRIP